MEYNLSIKDQNEPIFFFSRGEIYCFVLANRHMFSILGGWEWLYAIISNGTFQSYWSCSIPDCVSEAYNATATFVCINLLSFFQDFHIIFHMHNFILSYPISEVCQGPSIPAFNQVPDSSLLTLMAVGLKPMLLFIIIIFQVYHKTLNSSSSKIHPYVSCCGNFSIQNIFVHDWQAARKLKYLHLFTNIYFLRPKCLNLPLALICCANQSFLGFFSGSNFMRPKAIILDNFLGMKKIVVLLSSGWSWEIVA